jgi:DNA-binding CsgD family transcriptional regulator
MGLSGVLLTLVGVASAVSAIGALVQARSVLQRRESAFETRAPAANRGDESRGEADETERAEEIRAVVNKTERAEEIRAVVNKAALIEEIADKTNTSKTDAQSFFDAFTEVVTDNLEDDEQVQITGFGKFSVRKRVARQDVNIEQLTPRELEVLRLLASGETNLEIARDLLISERTVSHHLRNIFGKLGAKSPIEALDKARTAGLLR